MDYWAKTTIDGLPGISVQDHCLNVGCLAKELTALSPHFLEYRDLIVWLAACHDIGKISPGFQAKCPAWLLQNDLVQQAQTRLWRTAEGDHSKVSQFTIQYLLREWCSATTGLAAIWAAAAGMHHGTPHWRGDWKAVASGIAPDDEWDSQRRQLSEALRILASPPEKLPPLDRTNLSALWWAAGLITVADWIGSNEHFFPPAPQAHIPQISAVTANARVALADIGLTPVTVEAGRSFEDLFDEMPYPLQQAALATIQSPGVYVIEAAMGTGKTEAALGAAYSLISRGQATGLYFALPTQTTSNRIHERVARFLNRIGTGEARLIHGNSWLVDDTLRFPVLNATQPNEQRELARDWFASAKRALIAPFGVGTVDQALLGVIAVKHFFVRHYALAGKVVIIDEVHSYDVYTGSLIEALIGALVRLHCTIIILSATLTTERRQQLLKASGFDVQTPSTETFGTEDFPLISGVTKECSVSWHQVQLPARQTAVEVRFRPEAESLELAVSAARAGSRVLWICNTVDRAQMIYRRACSERRQGDPPLGLLHARFPFYRREQLETEWMRALGKERPAGAEDAGCLLISTQVVEQSVDLDADLLVTELAPTDMLFQRLGRLWRHHRERRPRDRPEMWIIQEEQCFAALRDQPDEQVLRRALGAKAHVYSPYVLLRTLEQWHDRTWVSLPGDIRRWLEDTYRPRSEGDRAGWKALLRDLERARLRYVEQAETAQNVWNLPALKDDEGVGTRLNDCPVLPLVLVQSLDENEITFFDGETVAVASRRFNYRTAKAIHRNMVKAPRWWFANRERCLQTLPTSVAMMNRLHLRGGAEMGLVTDGTVILESLAEGDAIHYDGTLGLTREPGSRSISSNSRDIADEQPFD